MSVYRFKSRETGDLVMLAQHGQRLLEILGKDPSSAGVIQPHEMSAAVQAIRTAVAEDEARARQDDASNDEASVVDTVSLRMRSAPFIEMLQRCQQAGVDIVWGV